MTEEQQGSPKTPAAAPAAAKPAGAAPSIAGDPPVPPPPPEQPDATYAQSDFLAQAERMGTSAPEIAGVFRQADKTAMTESEFTAALAQWRG